MRPLALIFLLVASQAQGDTVHFKGGIKATGKVEIKGNVVKITCPKGLVTIMRRDLVERIEHSPTARKTPRSTNSQLEKRISVDFEAVPLRDVLRLLHDQTGINIVLSPSVDADGLLVTLSLKDVSVLNVLRWITRQTKVAFAVKHEAVHFAPREELSKRPAIERYPVHDLTLAVIDRPRRPNVLGELGIPGQTFSRGISSGFEPSATSTAPGMTQDVRLAERGRQLIRLLTTVTGSQRWDEPFVMFLPEED